MTDQQQVLARLEKVASRLHRRTRGMGLLVGVSLTSGCAACLLFASKLAPVPHAGWISAVTIAFGAVLGALLAPRLSLREAAIRADLAAGTEEVLSTAAEGDPSRPFEAAALAQAAQIVRSKPLRSMLPGATFRPPGLLFAPIACFALLAVLPALPVSAGGREEARVSPERLRRLERDSREIRKLSVEIENKELAQLSQEMGRLVGELRDGKLDKKAALAELARLAEKAEGIKKELDQAAKALAELGKHPETKSLADALGRGDQEAAKKEAAELARQMGAGSLSADAKGALRDALAKMGQDAKAAGDPKLGDPAGKASDALEKGDAGAFGDQMSKLADSLKSARGRNPSSGGKSPSDRQGSADPSEEGERSQLDDASSDLADAKEDLSERDGQSTARGGNSHCDSCGRRKGPGGCQGGGSCPGGQKPGGESGRSGGKEGSGGNRGNREGRQSGTTNQGAEKSGPAVRDAHEDDPGPGSFGESEYSRLYAPQKTDGTEFEDLFANRQLGEGPMLSKKLIRGRPDAKGASTVPYKQALPAYRDQFEKAMNEGAIPSEYRDPVKKYFDTLNK